jgi:serine/threonine-protein kinase RsbW
VSQLRLLIDSDLDNISIVAVAINRICEYAGFDNIGAYQVELCVAEAMTNAIRHAYHSETGNTVSVVVKVEADSLRLEVSDQGSPMPADEIKRLVQGSKVSDVDGADRTSIREGGRGLQIIHDLMDEVSYSCEGSVNRLVLTKHIRYTDPERINGN